jgi:hypothetical protein
MPNSYIISTFRVSAISSGMTGVTSLAVVLVVWHALMMLIGVGLVMLMAENAFESLVIVRIGMAVRADGPSSTMISRINGEILCIVVPGGGCPGAGIMTCSASGREPCGYVVRIRGIVIIGLMAAIAIGRCILISVGVAGNACYRCMRTG